MAKFAQICSGKTSFIVRCKIPLNLSRLENLGKIKIKTPQLLILVVNETEFSFFKKGKILIKNVKDADEAEKMLLELLKKAGYDDPLKILI